MDIETFIEEYNPCVESRPALREFASVDEAWQAWAVPSDMIWAAIIVGKEEAEDILFDLIMETKFGGVKPPDSEDPIAQEAVALSIELSASSPFNYLWEQGDLSERLVKLGERIDEKRMSEQTQEEVDLYSMLFLFLDALVHLLDGDRFSAAAAAAFACDQLSNLTGQPKRAAAFIREKIPTLI